MGDFDSRNLPPHVAAAIRRAMGQSARRAESPSPSAPKRPKYGNRKSVSADGHAVDSQREARLLDQLRLRQSAGEIKLLLRQTAFHLPGGVVYKADAMAVTTAGDVEVWDAKGVRTPTYRIKKRQVEELYGVQIREF